MWINSKGGAVVAGNITQDPEFKLVGQNGDRPLFKFSVGIGKDEAGQKKYADVVAWGRLAEILKTLGLQKGDPVAVYGLWESKAGKNDKTYWTLQADFVSTYPGKGTVMAGGAPIGGAPGQPQAAQAQDDGMDFGEMPAFMRS